MMRYRIYAAFVVYAFVASATALPFSPSAGATEANFGSQGEPIGKYHEQIYRIPFPSSDHPFPIGLSAKVFRPGRSEPSPLVIINHGIRANENDRKQDRFALYGPIARWMADNGFVAVILVRQGYWPSEGTIADHAESCDMPNFQGTAEATAQDIAAAVRFMQRDSSIDAGKIVLLGQSGGAWGALAKSAQEIAGLVGVIGFGTTRGTANCAPSQRLAAAANMGRHNRVPALWIYAANDRDIPIDAAKALFESYRSAATSSILLITPKDGPNGHYLLFSGTGRVLWENDVQRFLQNVFR